MKNNVTLLLTVFIAFTLSVSAQNTLTVRPAQQGSSTKIIQRAIDSLSTMGGGIVELLEGTYISGGLELKSNITLLFHKGAVWLGSDKYADYNPKHDAFIYGENLSNIGITGEGTIDGVDCYNPNGEEGFRGPHCIRLIKCRDIKIKGITIVRSANWAINCRYCSEAIVENVKIRGGHDGLHTRFCEKFTVKDCDFRTGDDCFAGNDNRDFTVSNCKINTSCNGFRFGCLNLTVKQCQFWGPGESVHKIQKRNNMLAAFVHFSPKDDNSQLLSGNWIIEDCTVDNVDVFYNYNNDAGLWQTGKPVTSVRFVNIKATNLLNAFSIVGDKQRKFEISIQNSSFSFREGSPNWQGVFEGAKFASDAFFNVTNFGLIELKNVTFQKTDNTPQIVLKSGNKLTIDGLHPYKILSSSQFTNIKQIIK